MLLCVSLRFLPPWVLRWSPEFSFSEGSQETQNTISLQGDMLMSGLYVLEALRTFGPYDFVRFINLIGSPVSCH